MTEQEIKAIGIEELICRDPYHDPKVSFVQGRAYHREKKYLIPQDEPIYIIRGSDPTAVKMVEYYNKALRDEEATEIVVDHIRTSDERLETFKLYADSISMPFNLDKMVVRYNGMSSIKILVENSINGNLPQQDKQFIFVDFRLFDVISRKFLPDEEPVITFRGKDALLVQIIDKHNELLEEYLMYEANTDVSAYTENLIELNKSRKRLVKDFHRSNPDRVGVTCAIFQKPKAQAYIKALKGN